jgi:maltose/maltodextrin transport system permease protein
MLSRIATVLAAVIALVIVYQLYLGGNALLAAVCAGGFGLAFFVYTARSAYTARYLFPGLAGIAMFVVLPLVYTLWIGFTNYSSRNLLTFERATEVLLGEVYRRDTVRYQFTLHAEGSGFHIVLRTGEDDEEPALGGNGSDGSIMNADDTGAGSAANAGSAAAGSASTGSATTGSANAGSASTGSANAGSANAGSAGPPAAPQPRQPTTFITRVLPLSATAEQRIPVSPVEKPGSFGDPLPLKDVIAHRDAIKAITVVFPDGTSAAMESLREFTPYQPLYQRNADGTLTNQKTGERLTPNRKTGFYETPGGQEIIPGFRVYTAGDNYARIFTDKKFRGPFLRVFLWTIVFAGLTVVFSAGLGMLLAELLSWEGLRFAGLYRVLLFLPYAVPGFISILVFKGLFNRNFGEINLILDAVLGIRPNWIGSAVLAKVMLLIVNTWLGYPYFMLLCMGLQKSIPNDLYEASAIAGAGPITNFVRITWPLIRKPLTPLLISAFAYNFNNFLLIYLLTDGRPDFLDTNVPAGETDILVTYTYRIAFEDSGQQFGLAAAISTIIFVLVAILSVVNLRLTKANAEDRR